VTNGVLKSVLDIDINDAKVQRYFDHFKRYDEAVRKQPEVWKKIGGMHEEVAKNFAAMGKHLDNVLSSSRQMGNALRETEGLWAGIGRHASNLASLVGRIGTGLLGWLAPLGGIGGLIGGGLGLAGIAHVIRGGVTTRREAMGLGVTPGFLRGFDINMQRLIDPGAFLRYIGGMEVDVTAQAPAYALLGRGLTGNTGADAMAMLQSMRSLAVRTPVPMLAPTFGAYGLPTDPSMLRILHDVRGDEFRQLVARQQKDKEGLDIQDQVLKAWTDLRDQLERAASQIDKTLITGLAPLAPKLSELSEKFVKAVQDFMQSHFVSEAIMKLAADLTSLGNSLAGIERFATWISRLFGADKTGGWLSDPGGHEERQWWKGLKEWGTREKLKFEGAFEMERAYHLPSGLVSEVAMLESGGDPSAVGPMTKYGWRAKGLMQLGPANIAALGITDPFDPWQSMRGGAIVLDQLNRYYRGDIAKVLAGYNWGRGSLDALLAHHAADWMTYRGSGGKGWAPLPAETRGYVSQGLSDLGININIINLPGGSTVGSVSGAQAGAVAAGSP
jgi:soluble lytic murein transglycosylase-like protein